VHIRRRHTGTGTRYEKLSKGGVRLAVREGDLQFMVNLDTYLDTGLFADHRLTRELVMKEARGKRFLNLFCYTGSFTCYAAKGGARATTSVDASNTYLEWARENFELNGMNHSKHEVAKDLQKPWSTLGFATDARRLGLHWALLPPKDVGASAQCLVVGYRRRSTCPSAPSWRPERSERSSRA
jgi:hypothetical protein